MIIRPLFRLIYYIIITYLLANYCKLIRDSACGGVWGTVYANMTADNTQERAYRMEIYKILILSQIQTPQSHIYSMESEKNPNNHIRKSMIDIK